MPCDLYGEGASTFAAVVSDVYNVSRCAFSASGS